MVDAVNNNRDAVYTGIGAGVGAVAGGAYGGWLSKPLLKGDAPSDAFVKRYYDNSMKNAAEEAKKDVQWLYKDISETTKLKTKAIAQKLGLSVIQDNEDDISKKYKWDDVFADSDDLDTAKGKIDKMAAENATKNAKSGKELTNLKKAFDKLGDNPDENAVKEFVKKHAEILGEKADGSSTITDKTALETKVKAVTKDLTEKADELKGLINDKKIDLKANSVTDAMKKAARDTKLWAGAKWAAIGAAALGICSYIGAKMTAPKAPAETPSENA